MFVGTVLRHDGSSPAAEVPHLEGVPGTDRSVCPATTTTSPTDGERRRV